MDDTATRLRAARERAGYAKVADAANAFGWSYSTYAGHENGSRGYGRKAAERYARAFRVTANYLMFGDGPERADQDNLPEPMSADLLPVYNVEASAGDGSTVDRETIAYSLAFPPGYIKRITSTNPKHLTIISVKGDSMKPTLNDDDIVMLDMSKTSLGYEGLFVIRIFDVLHVKRLSHSRPGHVLVISDNREQYPPREYQADEIEVIGKVLWSGGKV